MEPQALIARISFLVQKSLGIWFLAWAIRHKADWDYKLSCTGQAVRWAVVSIGYLLAASLPGPGILRLLPGLVAICFLCWPNFAYYLTNVFIEWPQTEGRVGSALQDGSRWMITHSFDLCGETFGGSATLKSNHTQEYSEGQAVTIAYDPLNPAQSKILPLSAKPA